MSFLSIKLDQEKEVLKKLLEQKKQIDNQVVTQENTVKLIESLAKEEASRLTKLGKEGYYKEDKPIKVLKPYKGRKPRIKHDYGIENLFDEIKHVVFRLENPKAFVANDVLKVINNKFPDAGITSSYVSTYLKVLFQRQVVDAVKVGPRRNIYSLKEEYLHKPL